MEEGFGTICYDFLINKLKPFDPLKITTQIHEPHQQSIRFFEKRGFKNTATERESSLDLTVYNPAKYEDEISRIDQHGFRIITYSDFRKEDKKADYKTKKSNIKAALLKEKKIGLNSKKTFKKFFKKILIEKSKLKNLITKIRNKKLIIHGYGASTKGNVLLQFYNIGNKEINYIADRNPLKYNLFTPGTKIKIISENYSRRLNPDYYLVLPWHFKKEILVREKKIRKKGTKFIFPLPKMQVI